MKIHNPLFLALAGTARSHIKEIDIHHAKTLLDAEKPPIFIDVREDSEWQTGHLSAAIHLSKGVIERDIEKIITDINTPLVLYCSGGYRSAIAAESLQKMGYKNIFSVEGGISAWVNAGYLLHDER
jgi:rhodanese-related sulfurtransferase